LAGGPITAKIGFFYIFKWLKDNQKKNDALWKEKISWKSNFNDHK
jgi:hypothetical protein